MDGKTIRGGETKRQWNRRLKDEGRYDEFIAERDALTINYRLGVGEATYLLMPKYGNGSYGTPDADQEIEVPANYQESHLPLSKEPPAPKLPMKKKAGTKGAVVVVDAMESNKHKDIYKDRLPNGCPVWDLKHFKESADTSFHQDALWTEKNLARADLSEDNLHLN